MDFEALKTIREADPNIVVESRRGGAELWFTLPLHDVVDANSAKRVEPSGSSRSGKKDFFRRGLRRRQRVINARICGRLVGTDASVFIPVAQARRVAKEADEAARDSNEAPAGPGASSGDDSHLESCGEDPPDSASNGSRPAEVTVKVRIGKAALGAAGCAPGRASTVAVGQGTCNTCIARHCAHIVTGRYWSSRS